MFRVRNLRDDKWVKGDDIYLSPEGDLVKVKKSPFRSRIKLLSESKYAYQNFTGITDKQGTRLFEGDIVDAEIMDETIRTICTYAKETCGYVLLDFVNEKYYSLSESKSRVLYIVGNIYDNKELLEEVKQ